MNVRRILELIRRGWRKPPHVIARWLWRQATAEFDQRFADRRIALLTERRLLAALGAADMPALWARLAEGPMLGHVAPVDPAVYDEVCPGDRERILAAAEEALARRVDLLGSGPAQLGTPIDWHTDFKSGFSWPREPSRRLTLVDLSNDADVKVPWELSRLQWLIPVGQAYLLTGDDRHARFVRTVIEEWAAANPVAKGVNWACTMDVALRATSLVWLFQVFHAAEAWATPGFRLTLVKLLYVHGAFISRHLEWSDINGNHLTTDLMGLLIVGLFLGDSPEPGAWQETAWGHLQDELPKQVPADGVCFEASTAYHRLVLELFLWPALFMKAHGRAVDGDYQHKLVEMAEFVATYSRDDGSTPLWGDADDGRALPFGGQAMTDHRYLLGLVGFGLDHERLKAAAWGPRPEVFWALGPSAARAMAQAPAPWASQAFPDAGVFVMRGGGGQGASDHVFIECGPVGMAGRGGHGHNDCLGIEIALAGKLLVCDSGAYIYSADGEARNRYRATAAHNTPQVDGQEINRFVRPDYLWTLHDDAKPELRKWHPGRSFDLFIGAHSGYRRLKAPVTPVRHVVLDKSGRWAAVADRFEGTGEHDIRVPYHFAPGVAVENQGANIWRLTCKGMDGDDDVRFLLIARAEGWQAERFDCEISASYGLKRPAHGLAFTRSGALAPLTIALIPAELAPDDPQRWLTESVDRVF